MCDPGVDLGPRIALIARILITVLLLVAGWSVFHQLAGVLLIKHDPREAIRWDPRQPEAYYQLGLLYRDQIEHQDLALAQENLEKAVELNLQSWRYWLELARCYEIQNSISKAEEAYLKATSLNPRSAAYRWRFANFYLRTAEMQRALSEFKKAIELDPAYRDETLAILWRVGASEEEIASIWPQDKQAQLELVRFLAGKEHTNGFVEQRWKRLLSGPDPVPLAEGNFYIGHLLQARAAEARQQWIALVRANGVVDEDFCEEKNLVWNGEFELPLTGAALDWRVQPAAGFTVEQVDSGLKVSFDGTGNLDFRGVEQTVIVAPGATYRFSGRVRSLDISTEEGPYFLVVDGRSGAVLAETEKVLGTSAWKEDSAVVKVPPETQVVSVVLRRKPSRRIDNLIRGTLWVDWVRLRQLNDAD